MKIWMCSTTNNNCCCDYIGVDNKQHRIKNTKLKPKLRISSGNDHLGWTNAQAVLPLHPPTTPSTHSQGEPLITADHCCREMTGLLLIIVKSVLQKLSLNGCMKAVHKSDFDFSYQHWEHLYKEWQWGILSILLEQKSRRSRFLFSAVTKRFNR